MFPEIFPAFSRIFWNSSGKFSGTFWIAPPEVVS